MIVQKEKTVLSFVCFVVNLEKLKHSLDVEYVRSGPIKNALTQLATKHSFVISAGIADLS